MSISVTINRYQSRDLKEISSIDTTSLNAVVDHLKSIDGPFLRPAELRRSLRGTLDANITKSFTRQVISLMALRREQNYSAEEVIESLGNAIDELSDWTENEKNNWKKNAPLLIEILSQKVICAIAKTIDLAYDYTNLLEKARILTDIRPVYDEDASNIVGGIVTQTLRLHYYRNDDSSQSISIALDEKDIQLLKKACEKALEKSQNAKHLLKDSCKLNTYIVGEENSDAE